MATEYKKILTTVHFKRPQFTKRVVEALSRCDGIGEYTLLAFSDNLPGNPAIDQVRDILSSIDFMPVEKFFYDIRLGCNKITFLALAEGFIRSNFIIHLEDDTVPSRDFIKYMEAVKQLYDNDDKALFITGYSRHTPNGFSPAQLRQLLKIRSFVCWGFAAWDRLWQRILPNRWHTDVYHEHVAWDTHISRTQFDNGEYGIFPIVSRIINIGDVDGEYVPSVEWHDKNVKLNCWADNSEAVDNLYEA